MLLDIKLKELYIVQNDYRLISDYPRGMCCKLWKVLYIKRYQSLERLFEYKINSRRINECHCKCSRLDTLLMRIEKIFCHID